MQEKTADLLIALSNSHWLRHIGPTENNEQVPLIHHVTKSAIEVTLTWLTAVKPSVQLLQRQSILVSKSRQQLQKRRKSETI